jgi:peptidoglycan/LPS O-acetylase OafA/YrhL
MNLAPAQRRTRAPLEAAGPLRRFQLIEALRAMLALTVLLAHFTPYLPAAYVPVMRASLNAHAAVLLFIVISGFVITHVLMTRNYTYLTYIVARFCRLWPLFAVCVTIRTLYVLWKCPTFYCGADLASYLPWHAVMLHGVMPEEWLDRSAIMMLGPSWSISLEWQFYLVAPAIVWLLAKRAYLAFALLCAVACVTAATTWHLFGTTLTFPHGAFLPVSLRYFLLGVVSAWWLSAVPRDIGFGQAICAGALVYALTQMPVLAIWTSTLLLLNNPAADDNPVVRCALPLGALSYSIYLSHMIVMWWVVDAMRHAGWLRGPVYNTEIEGWAIAVMVGSTIALTLLASLLLNRFVEKPGMTTLRAWMLRRLQPRPRLAPQPAE